jgi:hypothetical protein
MRQSVGRMRKTDDENIAHLSREAWPNASRALLEPVPLEYSIGSLTCAVADSLGAVVGWTGAAQDRLRASAPDTRPIVLLFRGD